MEYRTLSKKRPPKPAMVGNRLIRIMGVKRAAADINPLDQGPFPTRFIRHLILHSKHSYLLRVGRG